MEKARERSIGFKGTAITANISIKTLREKEKERRETVGESSAVGVGNDDHDCEGQ